MTFSCSIWSYNCDLTNNCLVQIFLTYTIWIMLVWIIRQLIFWRLWICWWNCRSLVFNFDNYSINTIWSCLFSLRNVLTINKLPTCWCNWSNSYIFISLASQWSISYFSISLIINIRNLAVLIIWRVSNFYWSKVTISSYSYTFNLSLTWCITWNYWSIVFFEVSCCPVAVFSYFTSYFINCCTSS